MIRPLTVGLMGLLLGAGIAAVQAVSLASPLTNYQRGHNLYLPIPYARHWRFSVPQAGRYQVLANLTKAVDYAMVRVGVHDSPPREFDRYNRGVAHDKLELVTLDLAAGPQQLTVEIIGAHQDAVPKYMFGLDYLQLVPQR